jgi:hypothetical protein
MNETIKQLEAHRACAEKQVAALTTAINALASLNAGAAPIHAGPVAKAAPATKPAQKKGAMSAAGRARLVAAQKASWAKIHAAKSAAKPAAAAPAPAAKPKKVMSASAKAKIRAFQKARWAAINAAKAAAAPAAPAA